MTPSPSLGWLFRNMVLPRFVSMWQEMLRRHNYMCDLIAWKLFNGHCHKMGASSIQYSAYFYITRTDFDMSTVPATHTRAGDIFSTTTPNCCPVTAAHELVTQSRLRYSLTNVGRPPLRLFVSPSRSRPKCDVRLLRPGRARAIDVRRSSSAVQPRHVSPLSSATSSTAQFELSHSSVCIIPPEQLFSSEAQRRTVSLAAVSLCRERALDSL